MPSKKVWIIITYSDGVCNIANDKVYTVKDHAEVVLLNTKSKSFSRIVDCELV